MADRKAFTALSIACLLLGAAASAASERPARPDLLGDVGRPSDSCSVRLTIGGCWHYRCESELEKACLSGEKLERTPLAPKDWNDAIGRVLQLIPAQSTDTARAPRRRAEKPSLPNDSCSIRLRIGKDEIFHCDSGIYRGRILRSGIGRVRELTHSEWKAALEGQLLDDTAPAPGAGR
jgi:hypothetical protein